VLGSWWIASNPLSQVRLNESRPPRLCRKSTRRSWRRAMSATRTSERAAGRGRARRGPRRRLRWSDVDLKTNEPHVRQRVDRFGKIGPPKSDSGTRTIPFGADLALALKTWKLACPKGEPDLVFPSRGGTVSWYPNFVDTLGGARAGQERPTEIRAARLPAFFRVVVHQPEGSRRPRATRQSGPAVAWPQQHHHVSIFTATCFRAARIGPKSPRRKRRCWAERGGT
jgi:hypothetical protein